MFIIKITPIAYEDIQIGIDYYQEQQRGLGYTFADVIQLSLDRLANMPYSGSFAYNDVRYKVVDRFPYIILYKTEDSIITVLRIFNTHQKPLFN